MGPMVTMKIKAGESSQTTLKRLVYAHAMDVNHSGEYRLIQSPFSKN